MHDLHLAQTIAKAVNEHAQKYSISKVSAVYLELGDIIEHGKGIDPDNLRYNIGLLLPGAEVRIKKIKGKNWKLTGIEGL